MQHETVPLSCLIANEPDLKKDLYQLNTSSSVDEVLNKIYNQDLFEAIDYLPKHFVDLLIIDPPYIYRKTLQDLSSRLRTTRPILNM